MSLLDRGPETVTIFHEETFVSPQGNTMTRASTTDVDVVPNCVVQISAQSGTSARRQEQDNEGFETEITFRLRLPRSYTRVIGAQAQVEWQGKRYSLVGDVHPFNGSPMTAHKDYTIRRS